MVDLLNRADKHGSTVHHQSGGARDVAKWNCSTTFSGNRMCQFGRRYGVTNIVRFGVSTSVNRLI
jgi:hypothetical protein